MLLAASLADPTILNYLVATCGAEVSRTYTTGHPKRQKQYTCLITAVRKGAYAVVGYLLNIGCDPNRPDHKNRTPLHHAIRRWVGLDADVGCFFYLPMVLIMDM